MKSALIHSRGLETKDEDILHALKGAGGGWSKNFLVRKILRWQNKEDGAVIDDEAPSLRASGGTDIRKMPKIIQKSPDWREDGTLREFAENSPAIRKEMGDNLPMVLDDMYDGELRKYLDYTPSVTAHETGGWEDIKVLEHRGRTDENPKLPDLVPSLRSESHGHQPMILHANFPDGVREYEDESPAVQTPAGGGHLPRVVDTKKVDGFREYGDNSPSLQSNDFKEPLKVAESTEIRKLTPVECERLQGFPDGWTVVGLTKDGNEVEMSDTQRYKMMGNAVTVNVIEFIGNRFLEAFV